MIFITDQEMNKAYIFAENDNDERALSCLYNEMFAAGMRVKRETVDTHSHNDDFTCIEIESDNVKRPASSRPV